MGPRPIRRGNVQSAPAQAQGFVLQWGHVQSDVETSGGPRNPGADLEASMGPRPIRRGNYYQRRRFVSPDEALQWGHVQSDVETFHALRAAVDMGCFNGATSNQTWKPFGSDGRGV